VLVNIQRHKMIRSVLLIGCGFGIGLFKVVQQEGFHFWAGIIFLILGIVVLIDLLSKLKIKQNKRSS